MSEKRFENKKFEDIGLELIQTRLELAEVWHSAARIVFLESDRKKMSKGRLIYGECEKVSPKNQWAINADFTITIYTPNIEHFTEEQLRILLLHELMHVGVRKGGGSESYYIVPHDLEEFSSLAAEYGIDWSENKNVQMTLTDMGVD